MRKQSIAGLLSKAGEGGYSQIGKVPYPEEGLAGESNKMCHACIEGKGV